MSEYGVPCFVCSKPLRNVHDDCENQPEEGTCFETLGHYGSTAFDPQDGSRLEINICDECLNEHVDRVLWGRTSIVKNLCDVLDDEFDEPTPHRQRAHVGVHSLVPWKPELDQPTEAGKDIAAADEVTT